MRLLLGVDQEDRWSKESETRKGCMHCRNSCDARPELADTANEEKGGEVSWEENARGNFERQLTVRDRTSEANQ